MKKLQTLARKTGLKTLEAGLFFVAFMPAAVLAQNPIRGGVGEAQPEGTDDTSLMDIFSTVANILLFILGAVAVIMLIIGGFRYVVSGGDSNAVEGAKNTILYAVIGIVVAFLAWAAVDFVISSLEQGEAAG